MKEVYAYIRVSTVKQGEKGSSLTEQRVAIEAYARKHDLTIIEWFEEKETAAKHGRTVFTRMLGLLLKGLVSGVIIHKIDRSARNLRDWADLGNLVDRGIEIHFAHESLDLKSRGGRLAADIQAVVAADFIRNLRDEVRKGFQGRLRQGLYPLPAPIGYEDHGKGKPKTPHPVMGPLVARAFQLYSTGQYNLITLGEELYRLGLRNRCGGRVTRTGISTLLNNEFYIGLIHIRRTGERFEGIHEPLVTKELFDRVQDVLAGRTKNVGLKNDFRYRKMLQCTSCHHNLTGELQKGNVYYRCHTRTCARVSVRQECIDVAVDQAIQRLWMHPNEYEYLEAEFRDFEGDRESRIDELRQSIELQMKNVDARIERITDAWIDRIIDKDAYESRREAAFKERLQLREQLGNLGSGNDPATIQAEKFFELLKTLSYKANSANAEEKRDLLKEATSNLQMDGKNLVFNWQNPFQVVAFRHENANGAPFRDTCRTSDDGKVGSISSRIARKLYRLLREGEASENDN